MYYKIKDDVDLSALGRKKEKQLLEYLDWIDESRNIKW